jgi:hypothetical protein
LFRFIDRNANDQKLSAVYKTACGTSLVHEATVW